MATDETTTTTATTRYRCISDAYDADGSLLYDSLDEFEDMCAECFGVVPNLVPVGDDYHDESGLVLQAVIDGTAPHDHTSMTEARGQRLLGGEREARSGPRQHRDQLIEIGPALVEIGSDEHLAEADMSGPVFRAILGGSRHGSVPSRRFLDHANNWQILTVTEGA